MSSRTIGRVSASSGMTRGMIAVLAAYFALQFVLRILYASSLGLDEAEMMVITQGLSIGYGSQPPLYNWLQIAVFAALGAGIPAFAILHFLLLFATFVLLLWASRQVLEDDTEAVVATLALFTIPQLAWESQHSHTHTILAVTVGAASLCIMLRILKSGLWRDYVAFGVAVAVGVLSKYNYAIFAAALLLAALAMPGFRGRVLSLRMAVALLIAAACLMPHAAWVWSHPDETLSRLDKFKIATDTGIVVTWVRGTVGMLEGLVGYALLPVAMFALLAFFPVGPRRGPTARTRGWPDGKRYVLRVIAIALALVLLVVWATQATEIRDRWYQPILFILPLGLFIVFERRLTEAKVRALGLLSAGLAVAAVIGLVVVHFFPELGRSPRPVLAPYQNIAAEIRSLGFDDGYILAADKLVAGNLKHRFPQSTVAEPEYGLWPVEGTVPRSLLVAVGGQEKTAAGRAHSSVAPVVRRSCGLRPGAGIPRAAL